jgi:predicted ferric reductase
MSSTAWYFARSAGIVAYLLLSSSVVLGLVMSARARTSWPRFAVEEVHRFLAIATGVFVALHGATLLLDRVVPFSLGQAVVPFTSSYRPFAVGLGVLSAELMAAVGVSNRLRSEIPHRLWRRIHYATFAVWLGATVHGLLAGTDRQDPWFLALTGLAVSAVALAALSRFAKTAATGAVALTSAAAAAAVLALAFAPA